MLTLKHLGLIEGSKSLADVPPAYLAETLRTLMNAHNVHGSISGIDPAGGVFPTPNAPTSIKVTSVGGGFDVSVVDAAPQRGVYYFVEYDASPNFIAPRAVPMLTTRNVYLPLGTATYFFRAYAQYRGSNPSPYTVFGIPPTGVAGGAAGTPALQPTQGTGAGSVAGNNPNMSTGGGFGPIGGQRRPSTF